MDVGINLVLYLFSAYQYIGYYIMGKDKRKAQRNEYRINEALFGTGISRGKYRRILRNESF